MPADLSAGIPLESSMAGRGRLRRGLITLLALLMVTPQVLLRPCCCAADRTAKASQPADSSALPPCCLKRLQAAQNASAAKTTEKHLPGIHDSSRCACRTLVATARTGRALFKTDALRHLNTWVAIQVIDLDSSPVLNPETISVARSTPPDWGEATHLRLCRWLI